ncbi:MAG: DUF962 domain-containing protein [Proteobacteria bacterium]|nr:DUF962 domain-containing protein [Pseudomonadota bacterium]
MSSDGKLMDMLTDYAASHQHPFNVCVHAIGIPTIMLGVLIPLTWASVEISGITINLAHIAMLGFFAFYMTLDRQFAIAFLVLAMLIVTVAGVIGVKPMATSGTIAAVAFFGGYAAQFIGHAVEKSMPVLVKHPIQANLAAPFFMVVEMFKIIGLRDELFDAIQAKIAIRVHEKRALE